ncbi:MAG: Tetratricopeptide repeat protein [Nitrospira sp.]|nr:MAG: Tetratricopeptide repeat protein [Nitrospira sp.]
MYSSHRSWTQLTLLLFAWLCLRPMALGDFALVHAESATASAPSSPAHASDSKGLALSTLPDDGPRLEGQSQGMDALALQEGMNAYGKGEWSQARRFFEKVIGQQPESALTPTAMTFLAETALRENTENSSRLEALDRYKTLLRDYPQSVNAKRAEWRMADVYLSQGWHQEAQSLYERALSHNAQSPDGERALLGLGYTALALEKWRDAELTFEDLRKRSQHDQILLHATIGLASSFFQQRRAQDASTMYDLAYRRWPKFLRMNPLALGRYALIQLDLRHEVIGRGLLLQFYNLYPAHQEASAMLLRLADSLQASKYLPSAELLYGFIAAHYKDSSQAVLAAVRLATLRVEQKVAAENNPAPPSVAGLIYDDPSPNQSLEDYLKQMQAIAAQHDQDAIGSEALYQVAAHLEQSEEIAPALIAYKLVADRTSGGPDDPWPAKAGERLAAILRPWMEAAVKSHDDVTLTTLFHRHGPAAERYYLSSPLLLDIADAHDRLGFTTEAGRLYQLMAKGSKRIQGTEQALLGLAKVYLSQRDTAAARKVLERYRLEYPEGRFEQEALHLLVQTMADRGDWAGLLHFCRAWMLHHPKHPDRPWMYQQMASVFLRLNKPEEAVIATEEAFKAGAPKTTAALLAYADLLAQMKRHREAIDVYHTVIEKKPDRDQLQWARLQIVRGWQALKEHDRATVALAELGQGGDALMSRFSSSFHESIKQERQLPQEGL